MLHRIKSLLLQSPVTWSTLSTQKDVENHLDTEIMGKPLSIFDPQHQQQQQQQQEEQQQQEQEQEQEQQRQRQ
jgi:hypothetical protein